MPLICQPPAMAFAMPDWAHFFPRPKGSSKTPLIRRLCVRLKTQRGAVAGECFGRVEEQPRIVILSEANCLAKGIRNSKAHAVSKAPVQLGLQRVISRGVRRLVKSSRDVPAELREVWSTGGTSAGSRCVEIAPVRQPDAPISYITRLRHSDPALIPAGW